MRRLILGTILAVASLGGLGGLTVGTGYADEARETCSRATLRGMYLFAGSGMTIEGKNQVPFAVAGYEVYHGNGKVNAVASVSVNGEITRNEHLSGTYTVKKDCTGSASYPEHMEKFDMFIAPDGSMFTFISTTPGSVASGFELRGTSRRVGD
jgi:hypothetical protein